MVFRVKEVHSIGFESQTNINFNSLEEVKTFLKENSSCEVLFNLIYNRDWLEEFKLDFYTSLPQSERKSLMERVEKHLNRDYDIWINYCSHKEHFIVYMG